MKIRRNPLRPLAAVMAALLLLAFPPAASPAAILAPAAAPLTLQLAVTCPKTGELVIDDVKICYYTCPEYQTTIRIGATDICPIFH